MLSLKLQGTFYQCLKWFCFDFCFFSVQVPININVKQKFEEMLNRVGIHCGISRSVLLDNGPVSCPQLA